MMSYTFGTTIFGSFQRNQGFLPLHLKMRFIYLFFCLFYCFLLSFHVFLSSRWIASLTQVAIEFDSRGCVDRMLLNYHKCYFGVVPYTMWLSYPHKKSAQLRTLLFFQLPLLPFLETSPLLFNPLCFTMKPEDGDEASMWIGAVFW